MASGDINLSEQYLLECTPDSDCSGGYMEKVFRTALNGIPLEKQFPYNPEKINEGICSTEETIHIGVALEKYYKVDDMTIIEMLQ